MIQFTDINHEYSSVVPDGINWLSVTTALKKVKEPFEQLPAAQKAARNSKSKWYKMAVDDIINAWNAESKRSTDLGSWYHKMRENLLYTQENELDICIPKVVDGIKYAGEQRLNNNTIYPEHIVHLPSAAICGQADYIEIRDNVLTVKDYKTSKEIKRNGFKNWEGVVSRMLPPLQHLEQCEFNTYALQLSIYAYIISRWNPAIDIGDLIIEHVKFEIESLNEYSYPIYRQDDNGDYIIKEIEMIKVPYLRNEVVTLLSYIKDNK